MISHRLANVRQADMIYVMDKGKVSSQGKHEELLKNNDVYRKLYETQMELENYGKEAR